MCASWERLREWELHTPTPVHEAGMVGVERWKASSGEEAWRARGSGHGCGRRRGGDAARTLRRARRCWDGVEETLRGRRGERREEVRVRRERSEITNAEERMN